MGGWVDGRMKVASVASVVWVASAAAVSQTWTPQTSGVTVTFRGVSAVDAEVAWVSGSRGTVLRTMDGGATWATQFVSQDQDAFFDAMAFWDEQRGLAFSDSATGRHTARRRKRSTT